MYGESCKNFDYQAIVVSSTAAEYQDSETDLVLVLKSQRERIAQKNRIYGVAKGAFVPPTVERDFDNIEDAKNLQRRYAAPLNFGDIIQYNECDVDHAKNMIFRFRRERAIYEVSSNENGQLLKIGGVIEPKKPTTFWTHLDFVTIPMTEAIRAEPDVWLFVWVKVETSMKCSQDPYNLELTFDSFAGCDTSEQGRVCEAPWHRASLESKFSAWSAEPTPCDSDDEIDVEPRKDIFVVENKWAEIIKKQLGLFVGERLLLCKDLPQYDFIIPLLKPITATDNKTLLYPSVGEYFHFSAVWSIHHRSFLVTELIPVPVLRAHATTSSGNLLVRVTPGSVKGLFADHDGSLGLIDDPHHHLSFFEFHPASYSQLKAMVEVRAVRSTENRSVRYRIVRTILEDESMRVFATWLKTAEFVVGPIYGVLINRDTVISAKHPNLYFRLIPKPDDPPLPVGGGIFFRGRRSSGVDSEITISEWHPFPDASVRKVVTNRDSTLFQIELKPMPNHEQLAYSELMGPVDIRDLEPPRDSMGEPYMAWVRESICFGDCRRACTIMEVYSMALTAPILPSISSSRSSSRYSSSRPSPHSSSQGSAGSRSSATSITTNRFVGPGSRKASRSSKNSSNA